MSQKSSQKPHPRSELRAIVRRIGSMVAPHLPEYLQIEIVTRRLNEAAAKPFAAGTVRGWWHAQPDDERGVDSRHMDRARELARVYSVANDNLVRLPCPAVRAAE